MEHGPDAGASRPERRTGPGSSFRGALSRGALGRGWGVCGAPVRCTRTRSYVPKREVSRGEAALAACRGLCPGLRALL